MISRFHVLRLAGGAFMTALSVATSVGALADSAPSDHPALAPTRDVVVTYRFQAGANPAAPQKKVTVSFGAEGNRLRIDPIGIPGVTILDRIAQRVTLISMEKRSYVQFLPMNGLRNPFMLDLNMTFHANGMGKIAGYDCRYWSVETPKGKAQACVTEDGVILSEAGVDSDGVSGRMEALDVSYHDLPASTFEPPAGFHKFQPKPPSPQGRSGQPVPGVRGENDVHHGSAGHTSSDTSQPSVPNDSAGDGSVEHGGQPATAAH